MCIMRVRCYIGVHCEGKVLISGDIGVNYEGKVLYWCAL